ncbi:MAG: DUF4252 domain-containing protein [Prevotella sp.]|nr:DUF4252 domain-containing protein [Prevotella sp.]
MKKIFLAMATIMICAANCLAQDIDKVFDKFSETPGVKVINVDKQLLKQGFKLGDSGDGKSGVINIGGGKEGADLDNARVLMAESADADLRNRLGRMVKETELDKNGYEQLVNTNGEDQKVSVYGLPDDELFKSLVVFVDAKDALVLVKVDGKIDIRKFLGGK